jgi:hypothetical protein
VYGKEFGREGVSRGNIEVSSGRKDGGFCLQVKALFAEFYHSLKKEILHK